MTLSPAASATLSALRAKANDYRIILPEAKTMKNAFQIWRDRVAGATTGLTGDQIDRIAQRCEAAEASGEPTGVWHEAAIEFGTLAVCPCVPCTKARAKRA